MLFAPLCAYVSTGDLQRRPSPSSLFRRGFPSCPRSGMIGPGPTPPRSGR